MDKLNIGFIGGCINNQVGMARQDLYHSQLAIALSQFQANLKYQISLATYLSYDQLYTQTQKLITKKNPNILFLFIRPFPLMPLQKMMIKYDKPNQKTGWAFHPGLFSRKMEWDNKFTAFQSDNGYSYVKRNRFELRDLNLLAGMAMGLHHWSFRYINTQLELVRYLCMKENITLIIVSPPQNPESIVGDNICHRATRSIGTYCNEKGLRFININELPLEMFENDMLHFNADGHKTLADLIYNELLNIPINAQRASVYSDTIAS